MYTLGLRRPRNPKESQIRASVGSGRLRPQPHNRRRYARHQAVLAQTHEMPRAFGVLFADYMQKWLLPLQKWRSAAALNQFFHNIMEE